MSIFVRCLLRLSAGAFTVLSLVAVAGAETRTWTDSTGKHKIEAEFIEVLEGKARLKRPDGKIISLPLAKLSKADQQHLRELAKNRRGQADPSNPFEAGLESESPAAPRAGRGPSRGAGDGFQVGDRVEVRRGRDWQPATVTKVEADSKFIGIREDGEDHEISTIADDFFIRPLQAGGAAAAKADAIAASSDLSTAGEEMAADMSDVTRIAVASNPDAEFTPDPAPAAPSDWKPRPILLGPSTNFFEGVADASFAPSLPAAVIARSDRMGAGDGSARIELCNLKTGRAGGTLPAPKSLALTALSPSAKRLLTVATVEHFSHGPVQAWNIRKDRLDPIASWKAPVGGGREELKWLAWLDDDRALTLSDAGLILWDVENARGIYQVALPSSQGAALSPGRGQVAIASSDAASIHSAADGAALAYFRLGEAPFDRQAAFSPNGELLAVTGPESLEVFEIATGERAVSAYAPHAGDADAQLAWVSDEHVLVGGKDLVHVPSQCVVWTYENNAEKMRHAAGAAWYFFADGPERQRTMVPVKIPHAAAKAIEASDLALAPGSEVCLEFELMVDLANAQGDQQDLRTTLSEAIQEAGYLLVDDAPAKLVARMSPGETEEMEYHTFGALPRDPTHKMSITKRVYELEFSVDGQVLWTRQRVQDAPHHLRLEKDESVEQGVQRVMQPDANHFGSRVPSRLLKAADAEARQSRITVAGME